MTKITNYLQKIYSILLLFCVATPLWATDNEPLYPTDIKIGSKGELVITEKGHSRLAIYAADGKSLLRTIPQEATPTGVVLDGNVAYVTTFETMGRLHAFDLETGAQLWSTVTGSGACSPILDSTKKNIYVCNQFQNTITECDARTGQLLRTVTVLREPKSIAITPDGKYLYSTNFLPAQRADVDYVAACVSVIDVKDFNKIKDIPLTNGSNALRNICVTPNGKYIYVSHNLGRFTVPTSQLQQGWMNTSAFSIISADKHEFLGTIVVDEPERGAAGIWGISCNEESIYITHSGTHEVSVIDHKAMLVKFENSPDKSVLDYDLTFLFGMRERVNLSGNGPRSMVLTSEKLIIPTYFADVLNIVDIKTLDIDAISLNPNRVETSEDKGERFFNDAMYCFQNWQSCNGCHPGDGRTDGMNWDLMNDGVGNPKNCKSLLFSHVTAPNMISGIRASAEVAVRAGYRHIQFFNVDEEDAICVDEYLKALRPVPSPYLVNGELSEKAKAGQKVYERLKCGDCHSGTYYTDMKMYRIGEDIEFEAGWDTPTLREVWRTAPYLFDGRAATMKDVFLIHKHGIEKKVSEKDIDALTEYVNSL
ncbi:MAG: PQQ-binding-like beta-propeller repeat protein [Phocaeicola sp.]